MGSKVIDLLIIDVDDDDDDYGNGANAFYPVNKISGKMSVFNSVYTNV